MANWSSQNEGRGDWTLECQRRGFWLFRVYRVEWVGLSHGSKSERRNIAIFRMQSANYIHAHAGFKPSPLFNHPQLPFARRGCISRHCRDRTDGLGNAPIDSTTHVLVCCPAHAEARADLMRAVDSALASCGLTREHDIATTNRLVSLLLGSPHPHVHGRLLGHPTAYRDILRATARFIKSVHAVRWPRHA